MASISSIANHTMLDQVRRPYIHVHNSQLPLPEIVQQLAARNGPLDVYCWYEGTQGLPLSGAVFWKNFLFEPLMNLKRDVTMHLYSLRGWDFKRPVSKLTVSELGKAINQMGSLSYRCIFASSFFQYCTQVKKESYLYQFATQDLPKKQWLAELSHGHKPCEKSVGLLFENRTTLFDAIEDLDANHAYSYMQYLEGYYLIQVAVKSALAQKRDQIQIAFVMPNDEGKYYRDISQDIEAMLRSDFGDSLNGIDIHIYFLSFKYGDVMKARPYIDKSSKPMKVSPKEISFYLPMPKIIPKEGKCETKRES